MNYLSVTTCLYKTPDTPFIRSSVLESLERRDLPTQFNSIRCKLPMLSHPTLHQIHLSQATRSLKINSALPQSGSFYLQKPS